MNARTITEFRAIHSRQKLFPRNVLAISSTAKVKG